MKYAVGNIVLCPASGPVAGPRKGKIIRLTDSPSIVVVEYIDPIDKYNNQARVKPGKVSPDLEKFADLERGESR